MTEPTRKLGTREARLYIASVIAAVYVAAWCVIDRPPASVASSSKRPEPARPTPAAAPPAPPPPARAVWLDDLPPEQRRTIQAPPGWSIATRHTAVAAPVPQPLRVPVQRPRRVRTRSS